MFCSEKKHFATVVVKPDAETTNRRKLEQIEPYKQDVLGIAKQKADPFKLGLVWVQEMLLVTQVRDNAIQSGDDTDDGNDGAVQKRNEIRHAAQRGHLCPRELRKDLIGCASRTQSSPSAVGTVG
ncbi:hypothetical protein FGB62_72g012 [Gracilaria domingensis]|nr:hypothetical protein FGB62_72g012 [Gracilaria domingensis]